MKKLFLVVLLVALFVFTSCNSEEPVTKATPLTIELLNVGTITISNPPSTGMWYSINGGDLKEVTAEPIKAKTGTRISLYANGTENSYEKAVQEEQWLNIDCSADFYVYGNVMSLIDAENFENLVEVPEYAFYGLFSPVPLYNYYYGAPNYNSHLHNHDSKDLLLPATNLADSCYEYMFLGCINLTQAPELPATTLADECYEYMFKGCTSLTQAPELPATTLADYCYYGMFEGCTSLTRAPKLSATTLVRDCYAWMFNYCTKLESLTCLATTAPTNNDYTEDWLVGAGKDVEGKKPIFYHATSEDWDPNDEQHAQKDEEGFLRYYGIPEGWEQKNISEKPQQ